MSNEVEKALRVLSRHGLSKIECTLEQLAEALEKIRPRLNYLGGGLNYVCYCKYCKNEGITKLDEAGEYWNSILDHKPDCPIDIIEKFCKRMENAKDS